MPFFPANREIQIACVLHQIRGKKFASAIQYENLKSNSFTSKYNNAKVFMYECHQTNEKWEIAEM